MANHTPEETKAYVEALVPDFRKHREQIIKAYGRQRYEEHLDLCLRRLKRDHHIMQETAPEIPIEEIVNFHNDLIDMQTSKGKGDILDGLYNKQINIIAGMIIRGIDI